MDVRDPQIPLFFAERDGTIRILVALPSRPLSTCAPVEPGDHAPGNAILPAASGPVPGSAWLDAHADVMEGHDFQGQSKLVRLAAARDGRQRPLVRPIAPEHEMFFVEHDSTICITVRARCA